MKIFIIVLILLVGCKDNKRKISRKLIKVKDSAYYVNLTVLDTILIKEKRYKIGQILPIISKVDEKNGHLFLYDKKNYLVVEYDQNGNFISFIGKNGNGPGEYLKPSDIFIDKNQNKYIFDTAKFTTLKYNKNNIYKNEYKYNIGFPFPGTLFLNNDFKFITLMSIGDKGRYKGVQLFHLLDNNFTIIKSIKYDYPDTYEKFNLLNITIPFFDGNDKMIYLTVPALNNIYLYDLNFNLQKNYLLESNNFKTIDRKLDFNASIPKKIKYYSSFSLSSFLKIFNKKNIFYAYYNVELPDTIKSIDLEHYKKYYFDVVTLTGFKLNAIQKQLPGAPIDITDDGLLYLLLSNEPNNYKIGVYKVEIFQN